MASPFGRRGRRGNLYKLMTPKLKLQEPPELGAESSFPRVLILGNQVPHLGSPSAILFYRLFENWPASRLVAFGPDYHSDATRLPCRYEIWNDPWDRVERTRFRKWVRTLRVVANLSAFDRRQLIRKLGDFRPDVVVSLMEFQHFYAGAYRLARTLGRPFVLLVHDLPESFEIHFSAANVFRSLRDRVIYRGATVRLPISDAMERHLFRLYGARGMVLPPIPSSDSVAPNVRNPASARKEFVVGYAGSLDSRYKGVLKELSSALEGTVVRLNIYSRSPPEWPVGLNTCYRGYFEPEALWYKVQAECNALLFAFGSAGSKDDKIVRYSFPSKVPEYLRLGLPVVMAAPDCSAVWQWAIARAESFLLAPQDPAAILEQLLRLHGNRDLCARLGCAARRLYEREFEPAKIREQFRQILVTAADAEVRARGRV
jgi:glycosyltransferase involved in cell wall biosynthesis